MKIVAYARKQAVFRPQDIMNLTHLHIAFGLLQGDGTTEISHMPWMEQLAALRQWNPQLKILLSITTKDAQAFRTWSSDAYHRGQMIDHWIAILEQHQLDGIDIDWEYPCVPTFTSAGEMTDKEQFSLLCEQLRASLDDAGQDFLLSVAGGADVFYFDAVDVPRVAQTVDYFCVMTYDLRTDLHALTGHHTGLYSKRGDMFRNSCQQALQQYVAHGVPKAKLLLGAASYSRKWDNVPPRNNGLLQRTPSGATFGPHYHGITPAFIAAHQYRAYWDDEAQAPYLYNGRSFISYEDVRSITAKCHYIQAEQYAGIFYWEYSCDATGELLSTMREILVAGD